MKHTYEPCQPSSCDALGAAGRMRARYTLTDPDTNTTTIVGYVGKTEDVDEGELFLFALLNDAFGTPFALSREGLRAMRCRAVRQWPSHGC